MTYFILFIVTVLLCIGFVLLWYMIKHPDFPISLDHKLDEIHPETISQIQKILFYIDSVEFATISSIAEGLGLRLDSVIYYIALLERDKLVGYNELEDGSLVFFRLLDNEL